MAHHIPERQCSLCREKYPKPSLLRIVRKDDRIEFDQTGHLMGRGAYICKSCVKSPDFMIKHPLDRAFRTRVSEEVYSAVRAAAECEGGSV